MTEEDAVEDFWFQIELEEKAGIDTFPAMTEYDLEVERIASAD